MTENGHAEEHDRALFLSLVMMLSSSAMQQLGKLINPATQKAEVHLEGAQVSIDMLEMLRRRTRGSLKADEAKMLDSTLASLQMNYVEVAQTLASQAGPQEPGNAGGGDAQQGETPKDAPSGTAGGQKDPKYHKSYG